MALRFDLPDLLEDLEDEQDAYESGPCFPYPVVDGLPEEIAMKRLVVSGSLVRLNVRGGSGSTQLNLGATKSNGRKKVLLKLP
ncbi:hypothetical protein [Endozoicomonas arenosclerae]|uniref:hypothetical protein n=1 Tax=Endozoicomonas arenosclerae TaxID=1633495 RepID=UPI0007820050|nr:hypothetical protein [Endozoicomonas arenosclerae]